MPHKREFIGANGENIYLRMRPPHNKQIGEAKKKWNKKNTELNCVETSHQQ